MSDADELNDFEDIAPILPIGPRAPKVKRHRIKAVVAKLVPASVLQWSGIALVAIGVGAGISIPTGMIVGGVELVLVGIASEVSHPPRTRGQ